MGTAKSQTITVRVPTAIHEAVRDDADGLGMAPGTFLRALLVARYSHLRTPGISTRAESEEVMVALDDT